MARTERYTSEEVIAAIDRGHTAKGAATLLGCTAETIRVYARKYKTVAVALKAARKDMRDLAEMSMRSAILRGEGWAVMNVFKMFDDEGNFVAQDKPMKFEHSGPGGGPIETAATVTVYLPDNGRGDGPGGGDDDSDAD